MSIGLDWIRAMTNFVEFGLDPDCKLLQKEIAYLDRMWTELMKKNCDIFVGEMLHFVKILDFIWTWILNFLTFLDYGWTWTEF